MKTKIILEDFIDEEDLSPELISIKRDLEAELESALDNIDANRFWTWVQKQKASTSLKLDYQTRWAEILEKHGIFARPVFEDWYNKLSEIYDTEVLVESKADMMRLAAFAGEDLARRFLAIKDRLKNPENDLYYWIRNKNPEDLEARVYEIENSKSNTQIKRDIADEGAELVGETEHWKVYNITTFEASQKYGRDSKWCITGVDGYGDRYWNNYTDDGIDFYFAITKTDYDPRGEFSKVAFAVDYYNKCEIFDQQDCKINFSMIPYNEELLKGKFEGIDFNSLSYAEGEFYCDSCGRPLGDDEYLLGPDDGFYCEDCFYDSFAHCEYCQDPDEYSNMYEIPGGWVCYNCLKEKGLKIHHCASCGRPTTDKALGFGQFCLDCQPETQYTINGSHYGHEAIVAAFYKIRNYIKSLTTEEKRNLELNWEYEDNGETILNILSATDAEDYEDNRRVIYDSRDEDIEEFFVEPIERLLQEI